jgi:hypothetical protein
MLDNFDDEYIDECFDDEYIDECFDDEYIDECMSAKCPVCNHKVYFDIFVVDKAGVFHAK